MWHAEASICVQQVLAIRPLPKARNSASWDAFLVTDNESSTFEQEWKEGQEAVRFTTEVCKDQDPSYT
jgi:hypothetical protein